MKTIRYKSVIIDGADKTGQIEQVSDEIGQRLVQQGYAELVDVVEAVPDMPQAAEAETPIKEPKSEIKETKAQGPEIAKIESEQDISEWKPGDAERLMPIPKRKPKKEKR